MLKTYDSQWAKEQVTRHWINTIRKDPTMPDNLAWPTPDEGLKWLANSRTGFSSAHSHHPKPFCDNADQGGGGDKIRPVTTRRDNAT